MKDDELFARLERASRDCSGHEPSLSALQRAADEAAARLKALTAEVARKDAALRFYADSEVDDGGATARAALQPQEKVG